MSRNRIAIARRLPQPLLDALAPLGVAINALPLSAPNVWAAIEKARAAATPNEEAA